MNVTTRTDELHESQTPFFNSPALIDRLIFHAHKWVGTPFVAHAQIQGAGVDCVQLAAQIYIACKVMTDFKPPTYSLQEGKHAARSKVIQWVESSGKFTPVDWASEGRVTRVPDLFLPGDLLCFQFRQRIIHHVGVKLLRDSFIHVLEGRRVELANLRNYRPALRAVYRPVT